MEDYKKKYEEALETARKINSGEGVAAPKGWSVFEVIFPELKKSEDERIRKEIIHLIEQINKPLEEAATNEARKRYRDIPALNIGGDYEPPECYNEDRELFVEAALWGGQWQKEQTINKALKWLAGNVINYIWKSSRGGIGISDEFFIDFRKAMEQ